jgi:hypothetical protein
MFFSLRVVAASSYSGARALQCPHQGAKTVSYCQRCVDDTLMREAVLTLCEDEVVLLDETLEGILLEVDNVGSGGQSGCAEQT